MASRISSRADGVPVRTPTTFRVLDNLTGLLFSFVVVFAPWAFGSTVRWAITTTCIVSYALGMLLVGKYLVGWRSGFQAPTWNSEAGSRLPMQVLGGITIAFLVYTLLSALNYRAVGRYSDGELVFEYRDAIPWLPHSYDAPKTWRAFWRYLALACLFWAGRAWLLGKSRNERHRSNEDEESEAFYAPVLPARIRMFLWTFCISSALLALLSLLQRFDGTERLLWLVQTKETNTTDFSFGPFSYRANAAQYFNMAWPVCLGFWWALRQDDLRVRDRTVRAGSQAHIMLVPCLVFTATGPIASTSRGGAIIFGVTLAASLAVMLWTLRKNPLAWLGIAGFFAASVGLSIAIGGDRLAERFETVFKDKMSGRPAIYEVGRRMATDFPIFGSGAETFVSLYPLYRKDLTSERQGYAHDDWLETRITMGWTGLALLVVALLTIPWNWFSGRGVPASRQLTVMLSISLGGALLHARFDFPFQIFSLLTVFLMLACVGTCLGRKA